MADTHIEDCLSAQARQELEMVFSGRSAEDKPSEKEKDTEDAREKEDGRRPKWRRDENKGKGPSSKAGIKANATGASSTSPRRAPRWRILRHKSCFAAW